MQSFFNWMKKRKLRRGNPAKHLPKVKVPRRKPRPLRLDQIEDVLESGIYARTRDIILIAAFTGLRVGEVVKIRGEDIDLVGMTVRSIRKGALDWQGPLHSELLEIALRYPRAGWWFPSPYPNELFPDGGGHILMASASDRISKAIRAAGITDPRITAHSFRHYAATEMIRRGASVRAVQEFLGHASLATTQLYADVNVEDMRDSNEVLPVIATPKQSGRKRRAPIDSAMMAA
ncbi:MAG: tyrosine-type recombinase/integrase [Pseudolysinimonas sp.]